MYYYLEAYNLLRLNQEDAEILNRPITSKKFERVVKIPLQKSKLQNRWLHCQILPNIQRLTTYSSQKFPKNSRKVNAF